MNLIPYSRYAHTVLGCEKRPFLREFLDKPDTLLSFEWPPWVASPYCSSPIKISIRSWKKKILLYRSVQPRFSILGLFFFFFNLLKLCKISCFWSKSKKIWLKIFENNWKSVFTFFLQKMTDFWEDWMFLGELFLPPEKKKITKNVPINQPYLESLFVRKTGFLCFFVA